VAKKWDQNKDKRKKGKEIIYPNKREIPKVKIGKTQGFNPLLKE